MRAEREPVVDRLRDGFAEQVVHDVVRRCEALRLHRAGGAALGRRRPPVREEQTGNLVLLGHVVELVPLEVRRASSPSGELADNENVATLTFLMGSGFMARLLSRRVLAPSTAASGESSASECLAAPLRPCATVAGVRRPREGVLAESPQEWERFSESAKRALQWAWTAALHRTAGNPDVEVEPPDILVGVLLAHPDHNGEGRVLLAALRPHWTRRAAA